MIIIMTLTEFLLARIAEDEAAFGLRLDDIDDLGPSQTGRVGLVRPDSNYNPRLLAECAAKRRVVELHDEMKIQGHLELNCTACRDEEYPCPTLRAVASVYADHPDYHSGWGHA